MLTSAVLICGVVFPGQRLQSPCRRLYWSCRLCAYFCAMDIAQHGLVYMVTINKGCQDMACGDVI